VSTYNNPKTNGIIHVLIGGRVKKKNQILDFGVGCIMVGREKKKKNSDFRFGLLKCLGLKP
jgi:hypothetical protein